MILSPTAKARAKSLALGFLVGASAAFPAAAAPGDAQGEAKPYTLFMGSDISVGLNKVLLSLIHI